MQLYETFELSFEGKKLESNWSNADVTAKFTDAKGTKIIKGFYAGDGIYKVRYLPEVLGNVTWNVYGLVTGSGEATVEPPAKCKHGIVHADGTALRFDDGKWFHSFGTTIYELAHQNEEITAETFKTLSENPFNKVRMCIFPKHYDYNINDPEYFPFELNKGKEYVYDGHADTFCKRGYLKEKATLWNVNEPNFDFWNHFEEKIKKLDELGIQADLILFHPYDRWGFSFLSKEQNKIYLDYVIRRLAAFPNVWWSMANEYDFCSAKTLEEWYSIDEFIGTNDAYSHMLSNHNCFRAYDFERKHITHCSLQKRTMNLVPEFMEKYGKPVLYDECVYEGNLKQNWGALSGQEMTNRFWKVCTHGGYCTHGEVFLDMDMTDIQNAVLWWAKGGRLIGESPKRIAFLKNILEEIDKPLVPYHAGFWALNIPDFSDKTDDELDQETATGLCIKYYLDKTSEIEKIRQGDSEAGFAGHAGDEYFLYYYGTDCCARVDIDLPPENKYKIEVIDVWNMTRKTYVENVSGRLEVKLTGHEYMAVLATKI